MKRWKGITLGAGALAAGAAWLGLQQPPPPPLAPAQTAGDRGTRLLPSSLPGPARTYLAHTVGDEIPVIDTAIAWGTARVRRGPFWFPLRWTAYYAPGDDFYRTLEFTWFRRGVLAGYDAYIEGDGVVAFGAPLSRFETGPEVNQAENIALWAAAPLMPAVLAGDRARWEAISDTAARLEIPFAGRNDWLRASFSARSGRLQEITADRFRPGGQRRRSWRVQYSLWHPVSGFPHRVEIPHRALTQWADEPQPYADFLVDGIVYNVDVSDKIPVTPPAPPIADRQ
jgi:hypothetical protein